MSENHECSYCSESFTEERQYLTHLQNNHYENLGSIDKRRVDEHTKPGTIQQTIRENVGILTLGIILAISMAVIGMTTFTGQQDALPDGIIQPTAGDVHAHGYVDLYVNGEKVDLTQAEYQGAAHCFHFHPGQDDAQYHQHCNDVTPAYAMYTLGMVLQENGSKVTFEGTTFSTAEGDTVEILVNGQPVNPYEYRLSDTDRLEIRLVDN